MIERIDRIDRIDTIEPIEAIDNKLSLLSRLMLLLLFVLLVGCAGGENREKGRGSQSGDTLYTADAAMAVFDREPERALLIIDSAVALGNIDEELASLLRAKVYSQSTSEERLDTAQQILERLVMSNFVKDKPNNYEIVLDLLIGVSRQRENNMQYLQWSTKKVEFCREQGLETEALRTEAEIGSVLTQMGEEEKGLAKLSGVIATLSDRRHFEEMDACIIALKRKINAYYYLERSDEVIPLAHRIIFKINDYRHHADEYADSSYRMPSSAAEVADYCNFYVAQAQGYLARSYAELGKKDSARYYLALFEQSDYGRSPRGQESAAPIHGLLGNYNRMLAIFDRVEKLLDDDTLNTRYAVILKGRACAAAAQGDYRAASGYWLRYNALNNLLNRKLLQSRAYEYATRYNLQEEEMKTEKERIKAENSRKASIMHLILAMVILVLCIWLFFSRLSEGRKNKLLVAQIAEAVKYKNFVENQKAEAARENKSAEGQTDTETHKRVVPNIKEMSDTELYEFLGMAIRNDKLFTDPNFGRQTLTDLYNVNERRIGAAFSQGNGLTDFVREIRIEYACWLFNNNPEMTISEVSAACGFSSLPVFSREFKRKLDVTPSYYRSQI